MTAKPVVVGVYRPLNVSGVTTSGARLAALTRPHNPWRPLLVGPAITGADIDRTALADTHKIALASWSPDADPVRQILDVRASLRRLNARVVCCNDVPQAYAAAALDHHRGVRTLTWHHSSGHDGDDILLRCGPLSDAWAAVSDALSDRIAALGTLAGVALPPVPVCVPRGARPAPILPTARSLRLLYAGRLEKHHKRVMDLAVLADTLETRAIFFHMTIVGDGPAASELRTAMARHIAAGNATLTGPAAAPEMPRLYAGHDATLLVSEREGWPLAVSETLAIGRPVAITTGCGGAAEFVQHGVEGFIVPVGDMNAMATCLAELSASRQRIEEMSRAAFAAAARLTPSALGATYDAMVETAARAPSRVTDAASAQAHWARLLGAIEAIGPCTQESLATLRDAWLADLSRDMGLTVDPQSLTLTLPGIACTAERLMTAALTTLRSRGARRIAIYGAGAHTARAARAIARFPEVIATIDDHATGAGIITAREAASRNIECVVISSDEHERELAARAREALPGVEVFTLYEPEIKRAAAA
ncbi:MAG: glycosyltransferase family 4 protein [Planctomycetes bacterium]|nr:glycosyltransferase family 4 protein [Planctomycetota bacterium]